MPMTWNAEADAKVGFHSLPPTCSCPCVGNDADASSQLFAAVIQVTDLKLGTENLKKIADIMGDGKTSFPFPFPSRSSLPITQLTSLMRADCTPKALTHRISKFKALAKNGSGDGAEKKAPATKGKGGKKGKKADTPVEGEDNEEAAQEVVKGKKGGGKRKKAEEGDGEDEGEGTGKKVKVEREDEEEF